MSKGLKPGLTLPDIVLPDETGHRHRLSTLQGDNPMVLHLSRGEHCPRERQHHVELLQFHKWCAVAFTELVTIVPQDQHETLKLKIATGAYWTFLADEDLELRTRLEIDEYTDDHHDYAVVPHTLVLAPGLRIDRVYVGYWFWGRPTIHQLWTDLQALSQRIKPDFDPTTPEARAAYERTATPA